MGFCSVHMEVAKDHKYPLESGVFLTFCGATKATAGEKACVQLCQPLHVGCKLLTDIQSVDEDDQLLDAEESEVESTLQKMAQTTVATPTSTSALNRHACLSRTSASPRPS